MTDYTEKAFALTASEWMIQSHRDRAARIEAALREAHEAGRKEQAQWQLIETAPHDENVLLAYWDELTGRWHMEAGMASWGWHRDGVSNMSRHGRATHWLPLPQPPADAEAGHE